MMKRKAKKQRLFVLGLGIAVLIILGFAFFKPNLSFRNSRNFVEKAVEKQSAALFPEIALPVFRKPISEMNAEEIKSKIAEVLGVVRQLKIILSQITQKASGLPKDYVFSKDLIFGQNSRDVFYLQIFLNADPETRLATWGAGSPGNETIHFGYRTKWAVLRFQKKYSISLSRKFERVGYVESKTRSKINEILREYRSAAAPPPTTAAPPPTTAAPPPTTAAPPPVAPLPTVQPGPLNVSLIAEPSSGSAPLNRVSLLAEVSGGSEGTINYTFYCNRSDSGLNIIASYNAKYNDISQTSKTASEICGYSQPGRYKAKVIVEKGDSVAEKRVTIRVLAQSLTAPPTSPPTLSVELKAALNSSNWRKSVEGEAPLGNIDLQANVSGSASGTVNYMFDCDNNGIWDSPDSSDFKSVDAASKEFRNGCAYSSPGTYIAKVRVERDIAPPAEDTATIIVSEHISSFDCGNGICESGENYGNCSADCQCLIDYGGQGNLVINPYVECDNDNDGVPDGWVKDGQSPGHKLNWIDDPVSNNGKVLASQSNGTGIPYHFGWRQTLNLKPNTWYEFSASFASKDLMPNLDKTDNESLLHSSSWLGVGVTTYTKDRKKIYGSESRFWSQGPELTDFDQENWVYRTYKKKGLENWRTVKKYFKAPKNIAYAYLKTYNYPPGKGYFDNFIVKEVSGNYNPDAIPFKKSGRLDFIKYKGKDFFPIVSYEYPTKDGVNINLSELKQAGFNTAGDNFYKGMNSDEVKQMYENEDMAMLVDAGRITSKRNSALGRWWHNDPEHLINYVGAKNIKRKIDDFGNFSNVLFFLGSDELDCHPAEKGSYIPNLQQHALRYQYLKNKNSHKLFMFNNCRLEPYTGVRQDKITYYYSFQDVISYTHNLNLAYPLGNRAQELDKLGEETRTSIELSYKAGNYKPHLAFGIGVRDWQDWDGTLDRVNYKSPHNYVPFNLQRYQIFSQIINGAVGVWFYFGNHLNLNEEYDNYHYQQIKRIVKELSLLKPILLEKEFYDEWNVSDDKIEIMMKKHNNKIYLLTTSNSYEDIQNVKISLDSKYKISSVTAINDIINGDIDNPVNRVIRINSDGHSFNDDFIGDNENSFAGNSTPGYKVHIYEIEYSF